MKAKVTFKNSEGKRSTRTFEVREDEPNRIVADFIKKYGLDKNTYIYNIVCHCTTYKWNGKASESCYLCGWIFGRRFYID